VLFSPLQGLYTTDGHDAEEVETALKNGAIAIVAEAGNNLGVEVPASVPVIWAEDSDELSARLATVYYGACIASVLADWGCH
jgi:UDP-N-acetylmuramyl tripeptide synthase